MAFPEKVSQWRIGLVGYGEVGRILAEDLTARGSQVTMFDRKLGTVDEDRLLEHARAHGVGVETSHARLSGQSELIISAVTASQAVAAAQACAPGIRPGAFFLDFNSASPSAKIHAGTLICEGGGRYVEGAVMTSVPPYRVAVPLLLGGVNAQALAPALFELGFAGKVASEILGVASATKMCRSVMIKGLEAMMVECLTSARAYGVEEAVLASLTDTFPGVLWNEQATYFFCRMIEHGRRRSEEMFEVAQTIREIGLEPWSACGTALRQAWIAGHADAGTFGGQAAQHGDWRDEADRILASGEVRDRLKSRLA